MDLMQKLMRGRPLPNRTNEGAEMRRARLAFFTAFVILLLYTECASGGVTTPTVRLAAVCYRASAQVCPDYEHSKQKGLS